MDGKYANTLVKLLQKKVNNLQAELIMTQAREAVKSAEIEELKEQVDELLADKLKLESKLKGEEPSNDSDGFEEGNVEEIKTKKK